jgi:hypothetical protein
VKDDINVEIAQKLAQAKEPSTQWDGNTLIEIAEAIVLAIVAVATAWCGYQADTWGGRQDYLYGQATALRVEAAVAATEGGQQRLLDVVTFNTWIQAKEDKNEKLADLYVRRFSPEYRAAFEAWLKTEPLSNPTAVSGPYMMPNYRNSLLDKAGQLNREANDAFSEGTKARQSSERYLRNTLLLAMVLFLVALAQRFKWPRVRAGLLLVAIILMAAAIITVGLYHRL